MAKLPVVAILVGLVAQAGCQSVVCPEEADSHPCDCDVIGDRTSVLEIDCEGREGRKLNTMPDFSIFRGLPIQFLSLAQNNIRSMPDRFLDGLVFASAFLRQDPNIDLSSNPFTSIPDNAFTGMKADTLGLRMENTSLTSVPRAAFSKMANWTFLFLDDNRITTLRDGDFAELAKLRHIQLSDNPITQLHDGAFRGQEESLKNVHLSSTHLPRVPSGALANLGVLTVLALDGCRIHALQDRTFSDFTSKEQLTINLQENEIDQVSSIAFKDAGFSLRTLQLEENAISHLEFLYDYCATIFDHSPSIRLEGNPVHCDCNLFEAVESGRVQLEGTCGQGTSYAGMDLQEEFADTAAEDCGSNVLDTSCPKGGVNTTPLSALLIAGTSLIALLIIV